MKVLLIGGGGREHALAWKLKKDDPSLDLIACPGNPGIAELARCLPIGTQDVPALAALAERERVDLTIVGPEAPLAAGLVDELDRRGLPAFGPTRAAARIESSKRFAKELMLESGIPTAHASWHVDPTDAKGAARQLGAPLVVKASGLAAGKGVVICRSIAEADQAIDAMLLGQVHGAAGTEILVEEFMEGEELSVFAITDGDSFLTMLPAQDHKRLLVGDGGPNTGGMGAYAPVSIATADVMRAVSDRIIGKTLLALREHGCPFRGLLYGGLMLTGAGPKVVEFNCRFGDPETQVVIPLMRSRLLDLMLRAAVNGGIGSAPAIDFFGRAAVTTVVAAPGYPESPKTGARVELPPSEPDVLVFHAGTRRAPDGTLLTAGGRVVAATATADSIEEAQRKSLRTAELVRFPERYFRTDIGWRELKRRAGAA